MRAELLGDLEFEVKALAEFGQLETLFLDIFSYRFAFGDFGFPKLVDSLGALVASAANLGEEFGQALEVAIFALKIFIDDDLIEARAPRDQGLRG